MDMTIAALFVSKYGPYFGVKNIDPWDEERDATKYCGPHPVIAHPPCKRWSTLSFLCYSRNRREEYRPGNDGGTFRSALRSVETYGGVLEHPANSNAWKKFNIETPMRGTWIRTRIGWTCEVWQSVYGHKANKATWLYYVGIKPPFNLNWDRKEGTHVLLKSKDRPEITRRERDITPVPFKDLLVRLVNHGRSDHNIVGFFYRNTTSLLDVFSGDVY